MKWKRLFKPMPRFAYLTYDEELDLVAAGKKPVSRFSIHPAALTDPDHAESKLVRTMVSDATHRGLLACSYGRDKVRAALYICRPEGSWRVGALIDHAEHWNDSEAYELQESRLLGYSEKEIRAYMRHRRLTRVKNGTAAVYLVTPRPLVSAIALSSYRYVPAECVGAGTALVFARDDVQPGAIALRAARSHVLFRMACEWRSVFELFDIGPGKPKSPPFRQALLTESARHVLNRGLGSSLQRFSAGAWATPKSGRQSSTR